ncbi:hypothetical protein CB1_001428067 [Camelus ferus]|nr:hypothetical protein CB1_001428067 [Camelus ferus]
MNSAALDPVFWYFVGPKVMISLKADDMETAEARFQMQQRSLGFGGCEELTRGALLCSCLAADACVPSDSYFSTGGRAKKSEKPLQKGP